MKPMAPRAARASLAAGGIVILLSASGWDCARAQSADRKEGGCWARGQWYPEGVRVAPHRRSRLMAKGVFVCRNARWVFKPNP
jgi:hypothetical protein